MIDLGGKGSEVPVLRVEEIVPAGSIFVATADGRPASGQLPDRKPAVLEVGGESIEVMTRARLRAPAFQAGTYLNPQDCERLSDPTSEERRLRSYRSRDTLRKAWSPAGAILLILTALGILGAVASVVVAVVGEDPTSVGTVSERSQALISWVTAPADRLEGAAGRKVATARRFIHRREATAQRCLRSLAGGELSKESPAGVSCEPKSPPWWKDKDNGARLGLWIALATTFLGLFAVGQKFGFGRSPA